MGKRMYEERYADSRMQVKAEELAGACRKALARGRTGRLGLFEKVSLSRRGERDAGKGLPRRTEEGQWETPALAGERAAYEEFCAGTWGSHQIRMEQDHETVRNLTGRILRLEEAVREADREIEEVKGKGPEEYRKYGEANISEAQVRVRRKREHDKLVGERVEARRAFERALMEAMEEREKVRSRILEADHAVRLACEKAGDHTRLRMSAYWDGLLKGHKGRGETVFPAVPDMGLTSDAEKVYLSAHREFYGGRSVTDGR